MDLELTDEQRWIAESVDTLLDRLWPGPESLAEVPPDRPGLVWRGLVDFGALTIGGAEGLGAVELCLIARSLGAHLASVPFLGSAAVRLAVPDAVLGDDAIALALLEPGAGWLRHATATALAPGDDGLLLEGHKVAVEQPAQADRLAVSAVLDGAEVLALVSPHAPGAVVERLASFDSSVPMAAAAFDATPVDADAVLTDGAVARRVTTVGALLAAAEAVGAAHAVLELARRYAAERRQFGRPIGSFQSLRHVLAGMYVQQASGWSAVLYGAASFDDATRDAEEVVSIVKAYVARAAREVAHGAMQVFGGIAFTAEHPAHRFLRRIVVREQQFGDAADHERELGRRLPRRAVGTRPAAPAGVPAG